MTYYKKTNNCTHSQTCQYPQMHINPHFNQPNIAHGAPHINPSFYSKMYNNKTSKPVAVNAPKIYVNPKFVNVSKLYKNTDFLPQKGNTVTPTTQASNTTAQVNVASVTGSNPHITAPTPTTQASNTTAQVNVAPVTGSNPHVTAPMGQHSMSKYKLVNVKVDPVQRQEASTSNVYSSSTSSRLHPISISLAPHASTTSCFRPHTTSKYSFVCNKPQINIVPSLCNPKKTVQIGRYQTVLLQKLITPKAKVALLIEKIKNTTNSGSQWIPKISKNIKIDRRNQVASNCKFMPKSCNIFNINLNRSLRNSITIKGRMFSISDKSLRLIGPNSDTHNASTKLTVRINGRTYIQKSPDLFVRKGVIANRKSLQKNNIPCPQFRKFGRCIRKERGTCPLLHDKRHVTICRRFLEGKCRNGSCLLSHQVTAEKMPTCSFFLQGCCTRDTCRYLHVKVSDSALVCSDFLKGFCERGDQCVKRHVYLCPEYAKNGKCTRSNCPHPHKNPEHKIFHAAGLSRVRNIKINNTTGEVKRNENVGENKIEGKRYYVHDDSAEPGPESRSAEIVTSRCRLGTLPSFIKL